METQRGRSAYVTLKPPPILKPLLVVLAFMVVFAAGVVIGEFRSVKPCAICEKPLPILSHSGVHKACLQARIVQYANELDPMAGRAGMETDSTRPDDPKKVGDPGWVSQSEQKPAIKGPTERSSQSPTPSRAVVSR